MIPKTLVDLKEIELEAERCLTWTLGENVSSFPCRVLSQLRISKFWLESPSRAQLGHQQTEQNETKV